MAKTIRPQKAWALVDRFGMICERPFHRELFIFGTKDAALKSRYPRSGNKVVRVLITEI